MKEETEGAKICVDLYILYLKTGKLLEKVTDPRRFKFKAPQFLIIRDELFRRSTNSLLVWCVKENEAEEILCEVQSDECGSYSGGKTSANLVQRQGYFWPTLMNDAEEFSRRCK